MQGKKKDNDNQGDIRYESPLSNSYSKEKIVKDF